MFKEMVMLKKWCLASLALVLLGTPASADALDLNFQSIYPQAQTQNADFFIPWAESFAEKTNNELVLHFFALGSLVEASGVQDALRSGALDLCGFSPVSFPKLFPHAYLFSMPFVTKNARHGQAVLWALYDQISGVKTEIDAAGEMLTMWAGAMYAFSSTTVPVTKPEDIKGRRVLVIVPADTIMVEALGGIPVYVPPADAYVGLQRGMGEIIYTALPISKGLRVMELTKHVTPLASATQPMVLAVNHTVWKEDLTDAQRALMKETTGREMARKLGEHLDKDAQDILAMYEQAGAKIVRLSDEQLAVFNDALKPLIENYWVQSGKDAGLKDPKLAIERVYQIAASVPAPE